MNKHLVKARINRENRRMQLENMQRQAMAGWDANYHLVADFTNADHSNKWAEIGNTVYAVAAFVLALCAVCVYAKVIL